MQTKLDQLTAAERSFALGPNAVKRARRVPTPINVLTGTFVVGLLGKAASTRPGLLAPRRGKHLTIFARSGLVGLQIFCTGKGDVIITATAQWQR